MVSYPYLPKLMISLPTSRIPSPPQRTPIVPYSDPTERALHAAIDISADFERAATATDSSSRCVQISERINTCIELLLAAQRYTLDRANRMGEKGGR